MPYICTSKIAISLVVLDNEYTKIDKAAAIQVAPVVAFSQNANQNIHHDDGHAQAHEHQHAVYLIWTLACISTAVELSTMVATRSLLQVSQNQDGSKRLTIGLVHANITMRSTARPTTITKSDPETV